jgi:hypothetical protein
MNTDAGAVLPAYAFWDVDRENLDLEKDKSFIVSRMFERAKMDDIFAIIALYGWKESSAVLEKNKYLNRQALFLAHAVLGTPLGNLKAYAFLKHH